MRTPWDLAVIDEVHRLRNVYQTDNKIDDYAFGDTKSFRAQYARITGEH